MADKFGNYEAAFLMSGSVAIFASFIPFVLRCVGPKSDSDNHVTYLEELMDKVEMYQRHAADLTTRIGRK